ncbi:signal recognition particle subunit SRP68 [Tanacetum coccineum]|uniref:Signal recognition particle subunit SRP68 n=1 Tax=Tanacetum coccineum TaxID=301880 RepID=A0ABQ5FEK6_9ASTR
MDWVVCSDVVLESRDTVLVFVVTASRCICDAVSSHCREILEVNFTGLLGDMKRELRVSCYTDAGYLTDADDLKSQTGYVFILNGDDEYIAAFDASKEAVWIRKFISGLGIVPTIEEPINMYCDNTGAIVIAKDPGITKGNASVARRFHCQYECSLLLQLSSGSCWNMGIRPYGFGQKAFHLKMNFLRPYGLLDLGHKGVFGALNYVLGISVTQDAWGMFLCQMKYAMELFERAHMSNCNATRTLVDAKSKLDSNEDPDLHLTPLKRVLRYVRGTLDFRIQLYASYIISLVAYSDADWAGCPTTRRSTSGVEAEYRGVANVVAKTALLRGLHTPLLFATLVYCDNMTTDTAASMDNQMNSNPKFSINAIENHHRCNMDYPFDDYTRSGGIVARVTPSFLHLVLYTAERAWSHAMEKKQLPDGPNARQRSYLIGRLRKAAKWAALFSDLCAIKGDTRTSLEAEAYASYMKGILLFEQDQNLDIALKSFRSARQSSCLSIFFFMKGGFSSELGKYGDLDNQVLCRERVEELEPHIRYCLHKIGESNVPASELYKGKTEGPALDLLLSKLEAVMAEARSQQAASMTEFHWLGHRFPISNAKTRVAILKGFDRKSGYVTMCKNT